MAAALLACLCRNPALAAKLEAERKLKEGISGHKTGLPKKLLELFEPLPPPPVLPDIPKRPPKLPYTGIAQVFSSAFSCAQLVRCIKPGILMPYMECQSLEKNALFHNCLPSHDPLPAAARNETCNRSCGSRILHRVVHSIRPYLSKPSMNPSGSAEI